MKWTGGHGVAERRWNELGDWDYHITNTARGNMDS